jgi:hypothetical protein
MDAGALGCIMIGDDVMIGYIWEMAFRLVRTGFRYSGVLTPHFEEDSVVNMFCCIVYDCRVSGVVDSL